MTTTNAPPLTFTTTPLALVDQIIVHLTWLGYQFRLNELDDHLEISARGAAWQPMNDHLAAKIRTELRNLDYSSHGKLSLAAAEDVQHVLAMQAAYHPIKDRLTGLKWDGLDHLAQLATFFVDDHADEWRAIFGGAPYTGHETFALFLRRWLVGAVGKVFDQKQNVMLVVDAAQGKGKSYFAEWLASILPDYYISAAINPDDKDVWTRLMTKFIWEVGELGATTRRADRESLKNFISTQTVTVRRPYARYDTVRPAAASLIGTINNEGGFLNDPTGTRRFMTCHLTTIDWRYSDHVSLEGVWAQAVNLYRAGEPWQLTGDESRLQQLINSGYHAMSPLKELFLANYKIVTDPADPAANKWTPAMEIVDFLEVSCRLRGSQTGNLRELASLMLELGVQKRRVGPKKNNSYQGIVRQP